jgi:enoyl-CoA hydratase/carnithine racemase
MADDAILLIEDEGPVRILTMNRPDKLNALNTPLTQALVDGLEAADAAEGVRAIVLAGNGRAFCAGADLAEFKDLTPEHAERVETRATLSARLQIIFRQMRKPVVAAVHGAAVGGGAGLATACDMLVAGEDAKFGYPELKHGLVPALVMTNLTRQVGPKLAFELVSTGRLLSGAEMVGFGFANRVVPLHDLMPAALEIARIWARATPQAMAATKSLFYSASELAFEDGLSAGRDVNIQMRGFPRE